MGQAPQALMDAGRRLRYCWIALRGALLGPAFLVSVFVAVGGAFGSLGFLRTREARALSPLFRGGIIGGLVAWFCWKSLLYTMKVARGQIVIQEPELRSELVHLAILAVFAGLFGAAFFLQG